MSDLKLSLRLFSSDSYTTSLCNYFCDGGRLNDFQISILLLTENAHDSKYSSISIKHGKLVTNSTTRIFPLREFRRGRPYSEHNPPVHSLKKRISVNVLNTKLLLAKFDTRRTLERLLQLGHCL